MGPHEGRIVVVANRLPVSWQPDTEGWETSPGGLVSALTPILRDTSGSWVGWSGVTDQAFDPFQHDDISLVPVHLDHEQYQGFYVGFCNGTLWPLYHDAVREPRFHRHWWRPYVEVNQLFAEAVAASGRPSDVVWVQDYQLQLLPQMIRNRGAAHRIGFYLHIPFPPVELFSKLPWRHQVLEGLLGADVLAFQSRSSRSNFSVSARRLLGAKGTSRSLEWEGREIQLQVAPIGIDAGAIRQLSTTDTVRRRVAAIRSELGDPTVVILGVDRLDYTKGIDHRIRSLRTLFESNPDLVGKVTFVQVAVPSREEVEEYKQIRRDIEALVGRVNGDFATLGRSPVHYLYRSLPHEELIAYYRLADVMLVTPLRDGMNLVAKEYVATRYDRTGVLVLSEFAGAAEQLTQAVIVNPYDLDGLADALRRAIDMDHGEQSRLMRGLRRSVSDHDVFWWADRCLNALKE